MLHAIGKARVGGLAAEVEVGLAGMAHRPAAHLVREVEKAGLVGDLGTGFGRHEAPRRGGGNRCLLVAGSLAQEAAWPDRNDAWLRFGFGRCRDVQAVVLDEGLEYSLLGMSFLNRLEGWDVTPGAIIIHQ